MSKILKNITGSTIAIADTGVSIPAMTNYTIPPQDYLLWAASDDIITNVGSSSIIVNDGSSDLSISDGVDLIKGIFPKEIKIKGGTDGTIIGNVGDRQKVDAVFSSPPNTAPSYIGTKIRFDDMNASTGGVARDTTISSTVTYTRLYSYIGAGHLFAFTVSFEGNLLGADPFNIKLEIDGVTCFELNTLDIGTNTFWNLSSHGDEATMGLSVAKNTFRFSQKNGSLYCTSSLKIYIKKAAGGSKRFRGGMVYLTKE